MRKSLLTTIVILILIFLSGMTANAQQKEISGGAELLETGGFTTHSTIPSSNEIRVVSYNIRWRGGESLQKLIQYFRNDPQIGRADIICLQEVDRHRKRTNFVNTAKVIAQELKWNYAWAAPPVKHGDEEETGISILSPYPMSDVERMVLPNSGPDGRRRAAIGVTITIGIHRLRIYSVHAEVRIAMAKKMEQLQAVIESANRFGIKNVLIMGDFNTVKDKDVKGCIDLFTKNGFDTPISHRQSTFKAIAFIKFKLDWIWIHGLTSSEGGTAGHINLSDHKPLWVKIKLPD